MFRINENTKIGELLRNFPEAAGILQEMGMHCPGCPSAQNETLEEACIRECREEIGITPPAFEYLCSFPNTYPYKTLVYSTCDAFFYAEYNGSEEELLAGIKTVDGEAENCQLVPLATLDTSEIAFESMRKAVKILRNRIKI